MEQEVTKVQKDKKSKLFLGRLLYIGLILVLLTALVLVSVELYKEKNKKITLDDIEALQQEQANSVLSEIAKHIILPQDEQPTIATITDVESLRKEMPFFNKAQNGFKVIVYTEKAILFDPNNDIIVDVAPVMQGKSAEEQGQDEQINEEKLVDESDRGNKKNDNTVTEDAIDDSAKKQEDDELDKASISDSDIDNAKDEKIDETSDTTNE